ncbi:MAG TPA: hypothetical protein VKB67_04500 [Rhizomicrobium sp.]|nr:hypothetical protein [Rhizomicrobium sp.]
MLKNIVRISSLSLLVAFAAAIPASASEEDSAAPAGSFTADMSVPAPQGQLANRQDGAFCLNQHHGHQR